MLEADSCHRLRPTEERRGKGVEGARRGGAGGLGIPTRGRLAPRTAGAPSPPARSRPSPRRSPGCVTRWRPRGPGRVPGVRGGGGWGGGGKRPRGERPAPGPARRRPRFPLPGAAGGAGGPGEEPASKWSQEQEAAGGGRGAPWGRRAGGVTFWIEAVPEGRVGYPAGTRLPGHEFFCHRNLVSCQEKRGGSSMRLVHYHLALDEAFFPVKRKGVFLFSN
ncbi:translation initiation factor IF-2-like [Lutra lutra]|uniref:translation initiation factor IF-2-like n=1 Tax=Lutra lutra TaxID=9657 RepID=UPI001FD5F751|nr:translation initiation factor IF-2-like [Lutra lutra]